ncbi:hypothetical protein F4604DRAFT_1289735 [Suillus subluteus]|nr:hypothetical protein F4604DRAFT_1289735 [Suillus subluteus]
MSSELTNMIPLMLLVFFARGPTTHCAYHDASNFVRSFGLPWLLLKPCPHAKYVVKENTLPLSARSPHGAPQLLLSYIENPNA